MKSHTLELNVAQFEINKPVFRKRLLASMVRVQEYLKIDATRSSETLVPLYQNKLWYIS